MTTAPAPSPSSGPEPPSAQEIERLFRRPIVRGLRPVISTGLAVAGRLRGFRWDAEGLDVLESIDGPVVLAANHMSHADTAAILGVLPGALRHRTAVAAALDVFGGEANSVGKRALPTIVAAGFHAFAFDRHGPPMRSVRTSVQLIRKGWSLLLYPEGTRSRTGAVGSFKPGVGVLARFTGRPVIPVCVSGGRQVLPCGAFMPKPGRILVRFGAPMYYDRNETAAQFVARLEDEVRRLGGPHISGGTATPRPERGSTVEDLSAYPAEGQSAPA